ncbi:MAG: helix-turn-helix transcriptional regulator [Alphaproteobacteria bacterium]|nr:helix-turn-helix transcriptional regulator [Alphaproteobacteria bacterium]
MKSRRALAQNLRRIRRERGMSQEALAMAADIDRSYVSLLETERYSASVDMLDKLAAALKAQPHALLAPTARPKRTKLTSVK